MSRSRGRSSKRHDREIRQEVRRSLWALGITEGASVVTTLIRWGTPSAAIVLASYFIAGRETGVKVEGIFSAFANQWIYLSIAGICGGGWYVERKALRRRIKEMSDEKKTLESLVDPDRSSSGMNANGEPISS